ncbi:MAG: hypothetical protein A4E36_00090 [Methanoregulaceae archaeon PtaB.Bin009]|jgi:phage/plasmid-associated DNA primase|nr:MAG: hypothetical protein A4E36_00090 [Methanoregulaceae archaeon PtaB.Bin009]OPY42374.1 MAG: hypothetical protein A4E41_00366 [Methanoregulaceae archaeon PtaU1.Bin066]
MNGTESPSASTTGDPLLDRAADLMRLGATCTDEILASPNRLQVWVEEASQDPEIRAREEEAADLANLDRRLAMLTRENKQGNRVLEHGEIGRYLCSRFHTISFNKTLYIYEGGIYRPNAGDLEARIREIIDRAVVKCSISRETRDILAYAMTYHRHLKYPFNRHKDLIPVANGVVRIDYPTGTSALLPHSPEFLFSFKLPVVYDPTTNGQAFHDAVLSQYVESEYLDTLYQIPAQALMQAQGTKPYKKSYILQGDQDAGKTTYLEWLTALFGPENIAHASLHQIGMDRFVNAVLESKMLNTYDDLSDVPLENTGPFKALTGGFDHQVERKHQQPYQSLITAVHVFSCNAPPDVPEKILFDSAFWGRWEYVHFPNVFEVDPGFKERYFTPANLSGSFNRVIQMMIRIQREGLVINHSPSEVKDEWQLSSDPFAMFCRAHLVDSSEEHNFNKEHLLDSFQDYCYAEGINERKIPTSLKALTTTAFKNGFKDVMKGKKRVRMYATHRTWRPNSKYRPSKEESTDAGNNQMLG